MQEPYTLEQAEDDIGFLRLQVDRLTEILGHNDITAGAVPNTPTGGLIQYSSAGQHKYVSSDGNAYNTGRNTIAAAGVTTLAAAYTTVNGLSPSLALGTWHVRGLLLINPTSSGGTLSYKPLASGGLATSNFRMLFAELHSTNGVSGDWISTLGNTTNGSVVGVGLENRWTFVDGILVVSTAGTLNIQVALSSGAGTVVQIGTYLEVFPVT